MKDVSTQEVNKEDLEALDKIPIQTQLYNSYFRLMDVASQICDHYCKFPGTYDEDVEGLTMQDVICAACPLNKLLE